jgi:hypothetical protein
MPKYMRKDIRNKMPKNMSDRIPENISIIKRIDVIMEIIRNNIILLNIYIKYKYQRNFV